MNALNLLKNCPFCGYEAAGVGWNADDYAFRVHCTGCSALGQKCDTSDDAIEAWNRRHEDQPSEFDRLSKAENNHV